MRSHTVQCQKYMAVKYFEEGHNTDFLFQGTIGRNKKRLTDMTTKSVKPTIL